MSVKRVFVRSLGVICSIGRNSAEILASLENSARGIAPLSLFPSSVVPPLPCGQVDLPSSEGPTRTHALALIAAQEAMSYAGGIPDAIVLGVTTGGMPASELFLKEHISDPDKYRYHGNGTVAHYVAHKLGCSGLVLTVSTACSSSMAALKLALELLRTGRVRRVLAGGADGLCRLTYYGFNSLQLIDTAGAHPFDKDRRGMNVGEGAAMLLLEASDNPPPGAMAEVLGAGLSCDAYHPASPDPEGEGALRAMQQALAGTGISARDIEYVNLHGTGTQDNDTAEARALQKLVPGIQMPSVSSLKGATGHTLGAAGAVNAAVSVLCIAHGILPATAGYSQSDPALMIEPLTAPCRRPVSLVLTNAFGFGGNNASVLLGRPDRPGCIEEHKASARAFTVLGCTCLTGAGNLESTMARLGAGSHVCGTVPVESIMASLQEGAVRRLKRLPRMALSLALSACSGSAVQTVPGAILFGTGWGGLSETHDFLLRLFSSDERFTSPTDFIGSVHNAPAGQVAIQLKATGPNLTLTDGDYSFEQALFSAGLIDHDTAGPCLVVGADEYHDKFSPLFDKSVFIAGTASDGGSAFLLMPTDAAGGITISPIFLAHAGSVEETVHKLIEALGGHEGINKRYGAIFAGIPAACRDRGLQQQQFFLNAGGCQCPVIEYRKFIGEFASASAVAAAIALQCVASGELPAVFCPGSGTSLKSKGILLLSLGEVVSAVCISTV